MNETLLIMILFFGVIALAVVLARFFNRRNEPATVIKSRMRREGERA